MIPIRDHNPATRTPYVTYGLIAANVAAFLATLPLFADPGALQSFFLVWGAVPARIGAGQGLETLITAMFLHGGWMHLLGNMLYLHIFGDNLEDRLGHVPFAGFYLLSGIGAGLIQVAADPGSTVPIVGASGAIAGVMGGYLLMFPLARIDIFIFLIVIIRVIPVPAWITLGLWLGLQVFNGLGAPTDMGGVAYWAHAGGFVLGAVLMLPVWLRSGGPRFWRRTHGHPDHPEARYRLTRSRVPRVPRGGRPKPTPKATSKPTSVTRVPPVTRRR
ncbi:MAG: rhomboid family intramembrane serine protease [Rhodobacteraceae bacterium]|nr:rhomboid family intramembrane serine protease [Paracoccaceae bacterium]